MSDSLQPCELYSPWNSPGQHTGVGSLSLLQGIFPTQGLNPGLLHCRRILYQLSHKGSPRILEWVAYPFSRMSSWPRNWTRVSCIADGFFFFFFFYQLSYQGIKASKKEEPFQCVGKLRCEFQWKKMRNGTHLLKLPPEIASLLSWSWLFQNGKKLGTSNMDTDSCRRFMEEKPWDTKLTSII